MHNAILILYMPTANQRMLPFPPLGIAVLAGYLKRKGIRVAINDLEARYWAKDIIETRPFKTLARRLPLKHNNPKKIFLNDEKATAYLNHHHPTPSIERMFFEWESFLDVRSFSHIGFSVMSMTQLATSLCFAKYLKQRYGVYTIFGGSLISKKMGILLHKYPFVDFLVIGEGEIPLTRLLRGEQPEYIANMLFRRDNKVVVNNIINQYADNMEPDFDGLPFKEYQQYARTLLMPYEMSKGCKNRCSFCITRQKRLYFKAIDVIIDEIAKIKERYGSRYFFFVDNAINIDTGFSIELCQQFIRQKLDIVWSAYYIPQDNDSSYFRLLRDAGCIQLRWGIETFARDTLKEMNKTISLDDVSRALRRSCRAGIWNHVLFMIGYPNETMENVFQVRDFIKREKYFFKSALVSPFDFVRIDLSDNGNSGFNEKYINGIMNREHRLGISYRRFIDKDIRLKNRLLKESLWHEGIRLIRNFSEYKDNIERDQFLFNAFRQYHESSIAKRYAYL